MKVDQKVKMCIFIGGLLLIPQPSLYAQAVETENGNSQVISDTEMGTVEISFVDENQNQIQEPEVITGQVGDEYQYYPENIDNYIMVKLEGSTTGTYTSEQTNITIVYSPIEVTSEIDVAYLDEKGNELAPSEIVTGIVGETYSIEAKEIENYYLVDTFGMPNGEFDEVPRGISFIYASQEPVEAVVSEAPVVLPTSQEQADVTSETVTPELTETTAVDTEQVQENQVDQEQEVLINPTATDESTNQEAVVTEAEETETTIEETEATIEETKATIDETKETSDTKEDINDETAIEPSLKDTNSDGYLPILEIVLATAVIIGAVGVLMKVSKKRKNK